MPVSQAHRRIGVFGGTFDPVHDGHIAVAETALKEASLNLVLLIPTGRPWLREEQPEASADDRVRMAEVAVRGRRKLAVSRVDVDRPGETYTADTLKDLQREYGEDVELVLVVGADSALSMPRWKRVDEIADRCSIVVIGRPGEKWPSDLPDSHPAAGAKFIQGPMVNVSATEIRRRLDAGEPVRGMLPAAVENYIRHHGLYGTKAEQGAGDMRNSVMVQTDTGSERLLERAKELGALQFGDFTLTSGQKSTYYFDGRMLSLDPEGAHLISALFLDAMTRAGCDAFGGPTVAAVPIVGAVALRAFQEHSHMTGFFVRPEAKKHGMGRQIEGSLAPGMKVAVFDDTVSTGGSLLAAIDAVQAAGCEVALVLCVLDRKQGGSDEVKRRGLQLFSLWEASSDGDIRVSSR